MPIDPSAGDKGSTLPTSLVPHSCQTSTSTDSSLALNLIQNQSPASQLMHRSYVSVLLCCVYGSHLTRFSLGCPLALEERSHLVHSSAVLPQTQTRLCDADVTENISSLTIVSFFSAIGRRHVIGDETRFVNSFRSSTVPRFRVCGSHRGYNTGDAWQRAGGHATVTPVVPNTSGVPIRVIWAKTLEWVRKSGISHGTLLRMKQGLPTASDPRNPFTYKRLIISWQPSRLNVTFTYL